MRSQCRVESVLGKYFRKDNGPLLETIVGVWVTRRNIEVSKSTKYYWTQKKKKRRERDPKLTFGRKVESFQRPLSSVSNSYVTN